MLLSLTLAAMTTWTVPAQAPFSDDERESIAAIRADMLGIAIKKDEKGRVTILYFSSPISLDNLKTVDFAAFKHLAALTLIVPDLTDRELALFAKIPARLETFHIAGINDKVSDKSIVPLLKSQDSLHVLSLDGNRLSDGALKAIGNIKSLRILGLGAKMSEKGIRELANLDQHLFLDLTNADLPESALDVIGKMSSLRDISLAGTKVTDAGILKLANLANLERLGMLDLTDTKVTTAGVQALVSRLPRSKVTR